MAERGVWRRGGAKCPLMPGFWLLAEVLGSRKFFMIFMPGASKMPL